MITLITIGILVGIACFVATHYLIGILNQKNIVDVPNQRSLHKGKIPRGGGLVIVLALLIGAAVLALITTRYAMFGGLFFSILLWAALGALDDWRDLSPALRFGLQFLFAALVVYAFGHVSQLQLGLGVTISLGLLALPISVIGIVWLANLYNFMDGMDGLAASQTIIASITLSVWFYQYGDQAMAIICALLAIASYVFLLFNWHPAKVFMGDVGSVTIGAFFAILLIIGVNRYDFPGMSFILLFALFIGDSTITVFRRLFKGEKIWLGHKSHFYQRLANLGFNQGKIVSVLILIMVIFSVIASITVIEPEYIALAAVFEILVLLLSALLVVYLESTNLSLKKRT